jgi:hypothetical protein
MLYTFAYKIGHNLELAKNEFNYLSDNSEYELDGDYILTDFDFDISKCGSMIFKAKIHKELTQLPKKIGYVTNTPANRHSSLIKYLKNLGAKKILISAKEPNYGQVKYVGNWFIHCKEYFLEVVQFFDQELWARIDMSLPGKDMKKGIINLKLARSMANFTNQNNICDPFAGLGRNAVAIWDKDKNFQLSDIDPVCELAIQQNIKYVSRKIPSQSKVLSIATLDAKDIVNGFGSDFSIVTEGFLTDAANYFLSLKEASERMEGVKNTWKEIFHNWAKIDGLKEVVFCLPFFITRSEDVFWDVVRDLPKEFKIVPFINSEYIFYKRKDTRIGHMIVKIEKI